MSGEQDAAGTDPGRWGKVPTEEELAEEERARSTITVAEMVDLYLDDPSAPSRRAPNGEPVPGSLDVPVEELDWEQTDGR